MNQNTAVNTTTDTPAKVGELFDVYFDMIDKSSESPLIYHRWTLISAVAALLGREAYLPFGHDTIYPNMYVCLMGSAGSRKSSAINITRKLLAKAEYTTFAREKSSAQKFIKDLGEGFGKAVVKRNASAIEELEAELELMEATENVDPDATSEVYITAGELEDFLGQNDGLFISLLTNLWDNLDTYSHGKMTSEDIFINKPTVNMIGGTTPTTFATVFPPEVIGQGMLSRMLLVYGGGARCKITRPPVPDPTVVQFFEEHLKQIKDRIKGEMYITDEAFEVWDTIYQQDIDLGDTRLESYLNRRHIHYYKLCMIIAAMELTNKITKEIAIYANTILHYTEQLMPKALGEFGKSKKGDISQVIVEALQKYPKGISNLELFTHVRTDFDNMKEFSETVAKLRSAKVLRLEPAGQHGEALIHLTKTETTTKLSFVDLNLLREYRESQEKE